MKRLVTLRAATAATLCTLLALTGSACDLFGGSGDTGTGSPVTVWGLQNDALNPLQRKSVAAYNSVNNAHVTFKDFDNDPYKAKLRTSLTGDKAPDVFLNWGGGNLNGYVKNGKVLDLSNKLSDAFKGDFLPSVLAGGEVDGKLYAVPMEGVQPVALFHNKKAFEAAGIQKAPATWNELLADVDKFKAHGITPIALAGSQPWCELMWLEYLLDRVGGSQAFAAIQAGKPGAWDNPAVTTALNMISDLVKRGGFGTHYGKVNQDAGGTNALLSKGDAGMLLMGSWEYADMMAAAPKFMKENNLGFTAFPTVAGGLGDPKDIVGNPSNYFSVTADSKNQAGAIDFITKTIDQPSYIANLLSIGHVPPISGIKAQLMGGVNPEFTIFIYDMVSNAPVFTQSWDQALDDDTSAALLGNLQKLFNQQIGAKDFVQAMDAL